jgi:hypothetical protein
MQKRRQLVNILGYEPRVLIASSWIISSGFIRWTFVKNCYCFMRSWHGNVTPQEPFRFSGSKTKPRSTCLSVRPLANATKNRAGFVFHRRNHQVMNTSLFRQLISSTLPSGTRPSNAMDRRIRKIGLSYP